MKDLNKYMDNIEQQIRLNNGYPIPLIGFGTYGLIGGRCVETVSLAVNTGFRLVDTAPMYENEEEVGQGIASGCSVAGLSRDQLFITTKVSEDMSGRETIMSVKRSARIMGLEYFDLVLLHEPYEHFTEMYTGLEECQNSGLVRSIGVSNFSDEEYLELLHNCTVIPAVNQVECHIYHRNLKWKETFDLKGTLMQGYAPLTQGKKELHGEQVLREIADRHKKTISQIALRSLTQLGIPLIVKAGGVHHMEEDLESLEFSLSEGEMERIGQFDREPSLFGWD